MGKWATERPPQLCWKNVPAWVFCQSQQHPKLPRCQGVSHLSLATRWTIYSELSRLGSYRLFVSVYAKSLVTHRALRALKIGLISWLRLTPNPYMTSGSCQYRRPTIQNHNLAFLLLLPSLTNTREPSVREC